MLLYVPNSDSKSAAEARTVAFVLANLSPHYRGGLKKEDGHWQLVCRSEQVTWCKTGSMKAIRKAQRRRGLWRGKFHVKVRTGVDILEDLLFELHGIYFNRWKE